MILRRIKGISITADLQELAPHYGNAFYYSGIQPGVVISDADAARKLLMDANSFKNDVSVNKFVGQFLGHNVGSVNGQEWQHMRSFMDPAFAKLDKFVDVFAEKTNQVLKKMSAGKLANVHEAMQQMVQ